MYNHNPANNNCPRNADPRNESCACEPVLAPLSPQEERLEALEQVVREYRHWCACDMANNNPVPCDRCQKAEELLAAPKVDPKEAQAARDRLETAELLGAAYGVLHRIANDYYAGDTISTTDIDRARAVVIDIEVATETREKRKLNGA